ncbi:hypothetical protein LSH36_193g08034 [Paralvinella palmiformis]|uniref:NUCB1-like N-terminal domain-containing protein n=1 Tax=Paralvinella palmiformis TaxID=53620 RepID=A0AAD9N7W1_9ANNE|nr:hypothetical protein LSH36_193g08034 [Paralvinella palmiformis]
MEHPSGVAWPRFEPRLTMMKTTQTWLLLLVFVVVLDTIICPPVKVKKSENKTDDEEKTDEDVNFGLEYERYLKEVVGVLESDEIFKKKLQESNVSEIKSGEIARHLEFVSHNIRTRLDEIKRKEIDRLRQVLKIQQQIKRGMPHVAINPTLLTHRTGENDPDFQMVNKNRVLAHVDHKNPNTFEVEDLAKLIKRASQDLEDIDKQRRDEFKRYELEKEAEKQDKLSHMDEEHRKEEVIKLEGDEEEACRSS